MESGGVRPGAAGIFLLMVAAGVYLQVTHRANLIYVDFGDERNPAAVRRELDISSLEGLALSKKINERLVGDARVLERQDAVGVELGQFVTDGPGNRKFLACSVYNRVEMVFIGEGISEAGELPKMIVSGKCEFSKDNLSFVRPIWIPVADIKREPPGNKELNYYDDEPVGVQFLSMTSDWPSHWVLKAVRLYNGEVPSKEILVSSDEIRRANPKSIVLKW